MFTFTPPTLELPKIISKEINYGRYYQSPTSKEWFPSVTTVTGYSKKEFFAEWRKKPENQKELTRSSKRGTQLHSIIEKYLKNDETYDLDVDLFNFELFENIQPEVDKINNIVLQEDALWSDTLRLAGRVDCIADYDGELSVIDFKGSTKPKKEEWIQNYFEQATCYALMYKERFERQINQIVILVACEGGTIQVFKKPTKDYLKPLSKTIKHYWSENDFTRLQESMKGF